MNIKYLLIIVLSVILAACAGKRNTYEAPVVDGYEGATSRGLGERAMLEGEFVSRSGQADSNMIVYFQFDSSNLDVFDNMMILNRVSEKLQTESNLTIRLEGHTDQVGEGNYNEALSEKRAQQVRDYLIDHGIQANRIEITSYGSRKPHWHCDPPMVRNEYISDDSCFALNRRVEMYWQR